RSVISDVTDCTFLCQAARVVKAQNDFPRGDASVILHAFYRDNCAPSSGVSAVRSENPSCFEFFAVLFCHSIDDKLSHRGTLSQHVRKDLGPAGLALCLNAGIGVGKQTSTGYRMSQRRASPPFKFTLQKESPVSPEQQLVANVKIAIMLGALKPGEKLPSVRQLETQLGIGRNVVWRAYSKLAESGALTIENRRR